MIIKFKEINACNQIKELNYQLSTVFRIRTGTWYSFCPAQNLKTVAECAIVKTHGLENRTLVGCIKVASFQNFNVFTVFLNLNPFSEFGSGFRRPLNSGPDPKH